MSLTNNDDEGGQEEAERSTSLDPQFVPLEDLLRESKKSKSSDANTDNFRQKTSDQELRERETERIGQKKYYELRDKWSIYICLFIGFMLIFQLLLTIAVGNKWFGFDFSGYKTFLYIVIGENFAQIIAMGIIVAKFLFPQPRSKSRY